MTDHHHTTTMTAEPGVAAAEGKVGKLAICTEVPMVSHLTPLDLKALLEGQSVGGGGLREVVVVDVRGGDFKGGHIPGCLRTPHDEITGHMEDLMRLVASGTTLVFHCMYSQQRGPFCAMRTIMNLSAGYSEHVVPARVPPGSGDGAAGRARRAKPMGRVCVLTGGFEGWLNHHATPPGREADIEAAGGAEAFDVSRTWVEDFDPSKWRATEEGELVYKTDCPDTVFEEIIRRLEGSMST